MVLKYWILLINEGAAHGAGRGKEVIACARSADAILIVLDAGKEGTRRGTPAGPARC